MIKDNHVKVEASIRIPVLKIKKIDCFVLSLINLC